ncbi:MAG: transposase [Coriobacteriales bacterium]|nr:transposase [Coriobacteriales bacterium]
MVRTSRIKSESGVYHVMLRGIDQLQLFYNDEDRTTFLGCLERYKAENGFSLIAFALMGNHVHLLVKEGPKGLSESMRRLATSYARNYNAKYERVGYLFQNRFRSEPVESDAYLLQAVRYILNNPVLVGEPISYWTSYTDYTKDGGPKTSLTDTDLILGMLSEGEGQARESFIEFVAGSLKDDHRFLDTDTVRHVKDDEAIELIKDRARVRSCGDVATLGKEERDVILTRLKGDGLSIRQLSRLTGINRSVVLEAGKPKRMRIPKRDVPVSSDSNLFS